VHSAQLERQLLGFVFSSRRRHTRLVSDWSSDVCSSDLPLFAARTSALAADCSSERLRSTSRRIVLSSTIAVRPSEQRRNRSPGQIGRASCRERGEVSLVAAAPSKKRERVYAYGLATRGV